MLEDALIGDFNKVWRTITSCVTLEQTEVAERLIDNYEKLHGQNLYGTRHYLNVKRHNIRHPRDTSPVG